jgi:hypothetical protein
MPMTAWYLASMVGVSLLGAGCNTLEPSRQEDLGQGIVRGTLGAQPVGNGRLLIPTMPPDASFLLGQVTAIEGGAYVLRDVRGIERRVAHDENTRIDRPAHVGDRIEVFVDDRGRAIFIRNIDQGE